MRIVMSGLVVVLLTAVVVLLVERRSFVSRSESRTITESPATRKVMTWTSTESPVIKKVTTETPVTKKVTTESAVTKGEAGEKTARKINHMIDESAGHNILEQIGISISTEETVKEYESVDTTTASSKGEAVVNVNSKEKTVEWDYLDNESTIQTLSNGTRDCKPWRDWFKIGRELIVTDEAYPEELTRELDNWECPCDLRREYPAYFSGFDSDNKPIWILEVGKFDVSSMVERSENQTHFEVVQKCILQHIYQALLSEGIKSSDDQPVKKYNYLLDFNGFSTIEIRRGGRKALDFFLKVIHAHRTTLLRHLNKVFIINVNPLADIMVRVLRHSFRRLSRTTEIYGESSSEWGPALLHLFPKDQLPPTYGGTLEKPFYRHWDHGCEGL